MLVRRIMAELVDVLINIILLGFEATFILPMYSEIANYVIVYVILAIATYIALIILVQGLFWNNGESIGKYFMHLKVELKDQKQEEDLTFELMLVREFFVKYITFYFSCFPLLFNNEDVQSKVTNTVVRSKYVAAKV